MNFYLLYKSLHLISVICWVVGLLYLPRVFVYHAENVMNENISNVFKTMERKIFNFIDDLLIKTGSVGDYDQKI